MQGGKFCHTPGIFSPKISQVLGSCTTVFQKLRLRSGWPATSVGPLIRFFVVGWFWFIFIQNNPHSLHRENKSNLPRVDWAMKPWLVSTSSHLPKILSLKSSPLIPCCPSDSSHYSHSPHSCLDLFPGLPPLLLLSSPILGFLSNAMTNARIPPQGPGMTSFQYLTTRMAQPPSVLARGHINKMLSVCAQCEVHSASQQASPSP